MHKFLFQALTHFAFLLFGFGLGVYVLPLLTAPAPPTAEEVSAEAHSKRFTGTFRKNLQDSDLLHWGEGELSVNKNSISFEGELAPGPDYKLYLSPKFVETEEDFNHLKSQMVQVGDVKTFKNFIVPVSEDIDPTKYNTAVVWCESFGQFISAAQYQSK